jgi:hypothetical protein
MKTEAEIRTEMRYLERQFERLKAADPELNDKRDTIEKRAIYVLGSCHTLIWVLSGAKEVKE